MGGRPCTRFLLPRATLLALAVSLSAGPAFAHSGHTAVGFASGFMHPLSGWDHVAAMIAVGLWASTIGGRAIWLLPVVFPVLLTVGGAAGMAGVPLPAVEIGIALSVLVLGLLVAYGARPPSWLAALLVGGFAIFHGHAHGTELPSAAAPVVYAAGFVAATILLHLTGIAVGRPVSRPWAGAAIRTGGGVIALAGAAALIGAA